MTAELFATTGPFKFQAWCEKCQDGYNGSRVPAEDWRDLRNRLKHERPAA